MKTLNAFFVATALTLTAGAAMADVRPDHIPGLLKAGTIKDFATLNQAALAQHPGTTDANILDTELDQEATGGYVYEVDVRDTKGVKWEVKVNAATGQVLSNKQDK